MKKISIVLASVLFLFAFSSCLNDDSDEPIIIVDPPQVGLLGSDTISTGNYLGLTIGEHAESIYTAAKALKDSKGVTLLNVVANVFTDITELKERLPLYQSLNLDEMEGSESGIQIIFEEGKVQGVFLNSGSQLNQWPVDFAAPSAITKGDSMEELYEKLLKIERVERYKSKFESMLLLTKYISKAYDPNMTLSPQWYFAYSVEGNRMDEVRLNFKEEILNSIIINHYFYYR